MTCIRLPEFFLSALDDDSGGNSPGALVVYRSSTKTTKTGCQPVPKTHVREDGDQLSQDIPVRRMTPKSKSATGLCLPPRVRICLAFLLGGLLLLCTGPELLAQVTNPRGARPGSQRPGGQRSTRPGQKRSTPSGKTAPKAADNEPAEIDRESLPPGFRAPREVPEQFTTTKEWVFNFYKDSRDRSVKNSKYKEMWRKGSVGSPEDRKLLQDIVRFKLSEMTLKENRDLNKVYKLRQDLLNDVRLSNSNKNAPREVRDVMLETIVKEAPKLLEYHFAARLNAAILLAELNYSDADSDAPAIPYVQAYKPLINLLDDDKQLDAVRVWAVLGLVRICLAPEINVPANVRNEIVTKLVEHMRSSKDAHFWLQMRLAEGLGQINILRDQNKRPIVAQALAEVLVDVKRPWIVRAEAAQSLGRVPLDGSINVSLLAIEVARLTQQMEIARQKQPTRPDWNLCFLKIYLAFQPANEDEKQRLCGLLTQVDRKASLSGSHKKTVTEAYEQVLPIVQDALKNGNAANPQATASLTEWLKNNEPKDLRIAPTESPIAIRQAAEEQQSASTAKAAG